MFVLQSALLAAALSLAASQGPSTTPVPILKQLNRLNDDGSYSYGYEAADGSFKIETKYPDGEVAGKYGYIDESGNKKEISYGASKQLGFVPQGDGIVVPPAHSPSKHESINALPAGQEDDGQYREDPSVYEDPKYNSKGRAPGSNPSANFQFTIQPQNNRYTQPQPQAQSQQYYQPQSNYVHNPSNFLTQQNSAQNQAPQQFSSFPSQQYNSFPRFDSFPAQNYQQQAYQPQTYQPQPQPYQPQNYQAQNYQSQPQNYQNPNYHHPYLTSAPNSLGSYSINYVGKK